MTEENLKDELVNTIGRLVVEDVNYSSRQWAAISIVGKFKGTGSRLQGYVYGDNGDWEAEVSDSLEFKEKLQELRNTMQTDSGGEPWKTCLIQIKREDLSVNLKFDYVNENVWTENLPILHERLRPE